MLYFKLVVDFLPLHAGGESRLTHRPIGEHRAVSSWQFLPLYSLHDAEHSVVSAQYAPESQVGVNTLKDLEEIRGLI